MIRRSARFAAPVVVAGLIGLGAWLPAEASAATPSLPSMSAAKLLAKAETSKVSAFSGKLQWSAHLGLPSLSALTSGGGQSVTTSTGLNPTALLSGTHTVDVWVNGPQEQRLALPSNLAETDFVHNGDQAWVWNSSNQKVTHLLLPPSSAGAYQGGADGTSPAATASQLTPQALADRFLSAASPSTAVSVSSPVYVAGRAAYVLRLSPKAGTAGAAQSSVAGVSVAIDASTGFPLRVTVTAKGQSAPALQVGYTSLTLGAPAASEFAAPHGLSVVTKNLRPSPGWHAYAPLTPKNNTPSVSGPPWAQVVELHAGSLGPGRLAREVQTLTTPVNGAFGSARLLHTALLNVLLLPNGRVAAGFVTPAALEAAAARG